MKMTEEERAVDIEKTRLGMGMLLMEIVREMKERDKQRKERDKQRGNPKRPHISTYDETAALAEEAAVPDPIEIGDENDDNDNDNDKPDDDLFSAESNDDSDYDNGGNEPDDDNDPDDEYSQSTDDENKKKNKRSKRKTPQVPFGVPGMLTRQT